MSDIQHAIGFFEDKARISVEPRVWPLNGSHAPSEDAEEEIVDALDSCGSVSAEGQSFIIHYRDAKGAESQRSITVWSVRANSGGIPALVARCHLRKAMRAFRVDRIVHVFDYDGVSIEPLDAFYRDTFGFRWPVDLPERADNKGEDLVATDPERWKAVRRICRHAAVPLLCLLALSDGEFGKSELAVISEHAQEICAAEGYELSQQEIEQLDAYIRRTRPADTAVARCVERLVEKGEAAIVAFMRVGMKVIAADGTVNPGEGEALKFLYRALTGRRFT